MGRFLERLAETGNVVRAARAARVSRVRAYQVRKENEPFRAAWDEAKAAAVELVLEPEAFRRAVDGTLRHVYHQGQKVGSYRKYSDALLALLLKAHAPETYSERIRMQQQNVNVDVTQLTDEQLDRLANGEDLAVVLSASGESGA